MTPMTGGSLFSGIGGFELGAEIAGVDVDWRWQVEIDSFCRDVLARHFPHADRSVVDVREAGARNLAPVDVIVGGFPCQDISLAGKGAGLAGERSGLWREFARTVRDLRPRFVLVENVAALVTRGLADVLADLAALGFDAEWTTLRASDVGAPHRRERLFVVAYRHIDGPQGERSGGLLDGERPPFGDDADGCGGAQLADADVERRDGHGAEESTRHARRQVRSRADAQGSLLGDAREVANTNGERCEGAEWARNRSDLGCTGWPPAPDDLHAWRGVPADAQPSVCRLADGVPALLARRRERLHATGNAIVPQVAAIAWRRVDELARGAA